MSETEDFLASIANWPEKDKERAMREFTARTSKDRKVWYCKSPGRLCDGKPHEGYPYKHARGDQWPPADSEWFTWLLRGGRGSGKTRSGSEYIRYMSNHVERIGLIAPTTEAVRNTMIEGVSGLQAIFASAGQEIKWEPSKHKITFPSGAIGNTFSGEEPDRLRGPEHELLWIDEPAHIPLINDVWDMALFGLRLGQRPRICMTTTPKPSKWLKQRIADPLTRAVGVSTYENLDNLAPTFRATILDKYEGTRLGRQELYGELLEDVEGAMWQPEMIQYEHSIPIEELIESLDRIVVGIDPAGSQNRKSDDTGIVVVGVKGRIAYVLADSTGSYSPNGWAQRAMTLYDQYSADAIIVERNFGGDMVRENLKNNGFEGRIREAFASRGKKVRAEPIVGLYEQQRVFHAGPVAELEAEMTSWIPGEGASPNRVDALVWAVTDLIKGYAPVQVSSPVGMPSIRPAAGRFEMPNFNPTFGTPA